MTKDAAKMLGAIPCWVPHDKNPADALTKCDGAHCTPLIQLVTTCRWKLTFEEEELGTRAEYREQNGKANPRPRHSKVQGRKAGRDGEEWHVPGFQFGDVDTIKDFVNAVDEPEALPKVPDFPGSQATEAATEAFETWKRQVQMPELDLASDGSQTNSDDSLDEFVAQAMPRVGKATL